jgi:hypothetical protein
VGLTAKRGGGRLRSLSRMVRYRDCTCVESQCTCVHPCITTSASGGTHGEEGGGEVAELVEDGADLVALVHGLHVHEPHDLPPERHEQRRLHLHTAEAPQLTTTHRHRRQGQRQRGDERTGIAGETETGRQSGDRQKGAETNTARERKRKGERASERQRDREREVLTCLLMALRASAFLLSSLPPRRFSTLAKPPSRS